MQNRKNKNEEMLTSFEEYDVDKRWEYCISALRWEYTLSLRDACNILKCNRSWIDKYIRPYVHYIYLSANRKYGMSYLDIAAQQLEKNMTDSIWLNRIEFENLIRTNIVECTRQTIKICPEDLIPPQNLKSFLTEFASNENELQKLQDELKHSKSVADIFHLGGEIANKKSERYAIIRKYSRNEAKDLVAAKNIPNHTKRTKTSTVPVAIPDFAMEDLQAPHDMCDYGDVTETIYRHLFQEGYYRFKVSIPDSSGVLSEKIYYYKDPNENTDRSVFPIMVSYELYEEYLRKTR